MKYIILVLLLLFSLVGCANSEESTNNYSTEKISTENKINTVNKNSNSIAKEEELSQFSTTIYTKTEARQNNVKIACQELSETIVKPGEIFSFCNTLGPAQPSEGYQKADTFDANGDIFQEYGGGKCQVSSTLYNAVLKVNGLEIIERHGHSNKVHYIEEGKDAAVSYGSVDFKFKNNNSFSIKILAEANPDNIVIKIIKIP